MRKGNRLKVICDMIEHGAAVADIGTDHAALPLLLRMQNKCQKVIACDIACGPLRAAADNIAKSGIDGIELRRSNGLQEILPGEVDVIVIAGMGGTLISDIIANAKWLHSNNNKLILQPMSSFEDLRLFLSQNGFEIRCERAVADSGKIYSVIYAAPSCEQQPLTPLFLHTGRLFSDNSSCAKQLLKQIMTRLQKKADAVKAVDGMLGESMELQKVVLRIDEFLKGE